MKCGKGKGKEKVFGKVVVEIGESEIKGKVRETGKWKMGSGR